MKHAAKSCGVPESRREKSMGMKASSSTRCLATWLSTVTNDTRMNMTCFTALPAARTPSTPATVDSPAAASSVLPAECAVVPFAVVPLAAPFRGCEAGCMGSREELWQRWRPAAS